MEIKLKQIGKIQGSSGWFKERFEKGDVTIREGVSKKGHPLLILDVKGFESIILGCFNPYGLSEDNGYPIEFEKCDWDESGNPRGNIDLIGLTIAVRKSLDKITEEWCIKRNYDRKNDEQLKIKIIFE